MAMTIEKHNDAVMEVIRERVKALKTKLEKTSSRFLELMELNDEGLLLTDDNVEELEKYIIKPNTPEVRYVILINLQKDLNSILLKNPNTALNVRELVNEGNEQLKVMQKTGSQIEKKVAQVKLSGISSKSSGWGRWIRGKESKFEEMLKEIDKIDEAFKKGEDLPKRRSHGPK